MDSMRRGMVARVLADAAGHENDAAGTYFKNVNNKDVGTEYDFDRLMLDFNTKF